MNLKEMRTGSGLTQIQAAAILGIPFRTYCRYEDEKSYENNFKYNQLLKLLNEYIQNSILDINIIISTTQSILKNYRVDTCYIFGSYAKGSASKESDIDLFIISEVDDIEFFQLINELESRLHKKIDLIRFETAMQNPELMKEIMRYGIKIYG